MNPSLMIFILCITFDVFESFGLHRLLENVFDAQKKGFLLFHSVAPTPEDVSLFARVLPFDTSAFQN